MCGTRYLVNTHGHRLELASCSQLVHHRAVHFEVACRRSSRLSDKDIWGVVRFVLCGEHVHAGFESDAPSGVRQCDACDSAHPRRNAWWDGPSRKTRVLQSRCIAEDAQRLRPLQSERQILTQALEKGTQASSAAYSHSGWVNLLVRIGHDPAAVSVPCMPAQTTLQKA